MQALWAHPPRSAFGLQARGCSPGLLRSYDAGSKIESLLIHM